jgi:hypothetical protein
VYRINPEAAWLLCPGFADELERCEAAQGLEAPSVVVGVDEELQVAALASAWLIVPAVICRSFCKIGSRVLVWRWWCSVFMNSRSIQQPIVQQQAS